VNILLVSSKYPPDYSGSGNRIHNTYKRLHDKFEVNFSVICSSTIHNFNKKFSFCDVDVYRISNKFIIKNSILLKIKLFVALISRLNFWIEFLYFGFYFVKIKKKINLLHVIGKNNVTSSAIIYAKLFKVPLIVELVNSTENPFYYQPLIFNLFYSKGFPKKSLIICISRQLEELCKKNNILNTWHRPNPVNEKLFNLELSDITKEELFDFKKNDIVILHLAKFIPRKNQVFLLEVMNLLPNNYKLVLAGPYEKEGLYKTRDRNNFIKLKEIEKKYNLENRVKFIPNFIDNPEIFMKCCDIFCLPSFDEGLATPVLESLACGKPVIASKLETAGYLMWIKEGVNGKLIPLNYEKWARGINDIKNISKKDLVTSSINILKVASTEVIDNQYLMNIKKLIN
tara:strand:- start:368 stop:1564 length:1197 start_codon:yes stop_codon:yes gene_type:complete